MGKYILYMVFQFSIIICLPTLANDDKPAKTQPDLPKGAVVMKQNINEKTLEALEKSIDKAFAKLDPVGSSSTLPLELNQEAAVAKALFTSLENNNKIISSLALQSLPVALKMDGTSNVLIAINKAIYYPSHTELEVYAKMLIGDNEFYFGNQKVQYAVGSGFAGNASLALLGTQTFTNTNYSLSLAGGNISTAPVPEISQLKINCGVFDGLVLKGNFELNDTQCVALDQKGYETTAKISASIDVTTKDLNNINIKIKNLPAFGLKQSSSKIGFIFEEAEIEKIGTRFTDFKEANEFNHQAVSFFLKNYDRSEASDFIVIANLLLENQTIL